MEQHIRDSLLFLTAARDSICEQIKSSNLSNKSKMINYVRNEASDEEIINSVVSGNFTGLSEDEAWKIFKTKLTEDYSSISKKVDINTIDDVVFNLGPISKYGLSSARPIFEFYYAQGKLNGINEDTEDITKLDKNIIETVKLLSNIRVAICEIFDRHKVTNIKEAKNYILNEASDYQVLSTFLYGKLPSIKYDSVSEEKAWKDFRKEVLHNKDKLGEALDSDYINTLIFETGPIFHHGLTSQKTVLKHLVSNGISPIKESINIPKIKSYGSYKQAKNAINEVKKLEPLQEIVTTLLIIGAKKIYDNYFSKAAKACSTAAHKNLCIIKYKAMAQKAKVTALMSNISKCENEKCKVTMTKRIAKEKSKLQDLMGSAKEVLDDIKNPKTMKQKAKRSVKKVRTKIAKTASSVGAGKLNKAIV